MNGAGGTDTLGDKLRPCARRIACRIRGDATRHPGSQDRKSGFNRSRRVCIRLGAEKVNTAPAQRVTSVKRRKRKRIWQSSTLYGFVRARQLEGTLNESPRVGTHIVTVGRVSASWGGVSEKRWPRWRKGDFWPPVEPPGLDEIAKYNRSLMHYRVRDLTEMKLCLEKGLSVQFVVPIHADWYSATGGMISNPGTNQPFLENHSIVAKKYYDSGS